MTGLAHILLGAILVSVGVVAVALGDRIRGIRYARVASPHERARRPVPSRLARSDVSELNQVELARVDTPKASNRRRSGQHSSGVCLPNDAGLDDVIAALVVAGYKRPIATEAALGCSEAERGSIEEWARAALRRCAKGTAS